ncbi:hypothetical protein FRB99_006507 [Tulasnella sp. 403]|nr:hypothetical protein FRB99_006507 [Tulasnella sp. 403]
MQSDDVIWEVISKTHCSFKVSVPEKNQQFCKNPYNLSGLCNRKDCPLANSRYATVREHEGILYLYTKTIERAHLPSKMWERVPLSKNYTQALEQIDKELLYWPDYMILKCKQRVTKLTQMLIRMRKMKLATRLKFIPINKKIERREDRREAKALKAAHIEKAIEKELIERLKSKAYGDTPLNVNEDIWKQVLELEKAKERGLKLKGDELEDEDAELEDELENEEELEDEEGWGAREFVSDDSDEEFDMSDLEDMQPAEDFEPSDSEDYNTEDSGPGENKKKPPLSKTSLGKRKTKEDPKGSRKKPKSRGARVEVEYEEEREPARKDTVLSW